MPHIAISGSLLETVGETQLFPLGTKVIRDTDDGEKEYVYIFNDEASVDLAIGAICCRDPSATTETLWGVIQTPITTFEEAHMIPGVAQWAIPAGSYGFILTKGKGLVQCGTEDMTADTPFTSGGSGVGDALIYAAGAEHGVIGVSLEAEATDNSTFDAFINCLGA